MRKTDWLAICSCLALSLAVACTDDGGDAGDAETSDSGDGDTGDGDGDTGDGGSVRTHGADPGSPVEGGAGGNDDTQRLSPAERRELQAERKKTGTRPVSAAEQLEPLRNIQVWRFATYYFFAISD